MAMDVDMLRRLCEAPGAGGLTAAAETAAELLHPLVDSVETDPLGNVLGLRRCGLDNAPLLLLEAHIDEIGFIVTSIDKQGFVHVSPCGGVDKRTLAAAEVTLWADKPLHGVFCSTPPHLSGGQKEEEEALPEIPDLGLDVGLDAKRAVKRVPIGTRGTFFARFERLNDHLVCSKSLDDRAGVAAILYALTLLREAPLRCDLAVAFAVQEELGCRGSAAAAFACQPSAAIATDVSFAFTPDAKRAKCGELGKGPMLGFAPSLDAAMTGALERLAAKEKIAVQHEVMGGDTGTDADSISGTREGIPTALLSIPLRYMHTPNELIDLRDVEAVGRLMAAYVRQGGAQA